MGVNQRGISRRQEGSEKSQAEDALLYLGLDWLLQDSRGEQRTAGGQAVLTVMRTGGSAPYKLTQFRAKKTSLTTPPFFAHHAVSKKVTRR